MSTMIEPVSFTLALILALCLCPVARRVGETLGVVDHPSLDELKIHTRPVSLLGGVAVVLATLGALAALPAGYPIVILVAALVALGGGLVDDVRPLSPLPRVLILTVSGGILAVEIRSEPAVALGAIGVIMLVLACANAVNLMDGQDGLAGGLGVLAGLGLAAVSATLGLEDPAYLALALAGALGGFLVWNRPPARIFLGNSGAYAVGVLLAAVAMMITVSSGWRGLLASGMVLGAFVFETCFTVVRRRVSGDALTRGDRAHSYDLLAIRLGSRTRSTLVFWMIGLGTAGLGLAIAGVPLSVGVAIIVLTTVMACLFGRALWKRRSAEPKRVQVDADGSD